MTESGKGPAALLGHEDRWRTRMGLSFPAERRVVFRGRDLFHELKDLRWMELLLYGITGRRFTDEQIRLFEGIWVLCTSYPDPRIWNNRVAALAGTVRSTGTLGVSAAIGISEASIYGLRPMIRIFDLLRIFREKIEKGEELEKLLIDERAKHRIIPGYGRPIADQDERIQPLMDLADTLGFSHGEHVRLAFGIERILEESSGLKMNIAALMAALAADQKLAPKEYYQYCLLCFTAGIVPCFSDSAEKSEGTFLPLPCKRVAYTGRPARRWL